jgi:hypothetical protein
LPELGPALDGAFEPCCAAGDCAGAGVPLNSTPKEKTADTFKKQRIDFILQKLLGPEQPDYRTAERRSCKFDDTVDLPVPERMCKSKK